MESAEYVEYVRTLPLDPAPESPGARLGGGGHLPVRELQRAGEEGHDHEDRHGERPRTQVLFGTVDGTMDLS